MYLCFNKSICLQKRKPQDGALCEETSIPTIFSEYSSLCIEWKVNVSYVVEKKLHPVLPYRACCTACVVHRQNILGRQSDTGLGSAWGRTLHWCLMIAALRDTTNTIYMNI